MIHSKSDNIEIMTNNKADEGTEEFFESLLLFQIPNWVGNINERQ